MESMNWGMWLAAIAAAVAAFMQSMKASKMIDAQKLDIQALQSDKQDKLVKLEPLKAKEVMVVLKKAPTPIKKAVAKKRRRA